MSDDLEYQEPKKDKDPGLIILSKKGIPICSEHGYSLWVSEIHAKNNCGLCLYSDDIIFANKGIKLEKKHTSTVAIPDELKAFAKYFAELEEMSKPIDEEMINLTIQEYGR